MAGNVYQALKVGENLIREGYKIEDTKNYAIGSASFDEKTKKYTFNFKPTELSNVKTYAYELGDLVFDIVNLLKNNKEVTVNIKAGSKDIGSVKLDDQIGVLSKYLGKLAYSYKGACNGLQFLLEKQNKLKAEDLILLYVAAKVVSRQYEHIEIEGTVYATESAKVKIPVEHKGVLEVPEGKEVDELPLSHFEELVRRKGYKKVVRALTNLEIWNKNKNPKLSKWARKVIQKLHAKFRPETESEDDEIIVLIKANNLDELRKLCKSDEELEKLLCQKYVEVDDDLMKSNIRDMLESINGYCEEIENEATVLHLVYGYELAEAMLEAEEIAVKDKAEKLPQLPIQSNIDVDLISMAILTYHYDAAPFKALALNALEKLGVKQWLKEIKDIKLATKILNSLITHKSYYRIARLYTFPALAKLATTTAIKPPASIPDAELIKLGKRLGVIFAYDALK